MAEKFEWLRPSPERIEKVVEEISYGSEPRASFYGLVATSTLIASIGLMANSTAVIIGAMLVAPLMTPIFGIALALVRGSPSLLGRAIRAEVAGVLLAVGIAGIFGLFPLALQVTPEMLSRTEPNLLDLLVAILAGLAGAYALVDEHISPALPGVAIATAIVPPLANTGLCMAVGAYKGAYGSFLLFLANFLSILLVASATFIAAGLARRISWADKWEYGRRFAVAGVGFLVVAIFLTHTLVRIVKDRYLENSIKTVISSEFSQFPSTSLVSTIHQIYNDKLYVLATVRTPKVISPNRVKIIERELGKKLEVPTELIVRAILAKDVRSTGSTSQVAAQNLDGFFLTGKLTPEVLKVQIAEQALREILTLRPELNLMDVDLLHFPRGPVILATIQGSRVLIPAEVQKLEKAVRHRLQDPNLHLLTRCLTTVDVDSQGRILYGQAHFGTQSPEEEARQKKIEEAVKDEFKKFPDIFATNVDAMSKDDYWGVRVEAVGARIMSVREVANLERAVRRRVDTPIKIYLWSRGEVMITPDGYSSLEEFTGKHLQEREEAGASSPAAPEGAQPSNNPR